jgi:hypothetical protein
MLSQFTLSLSKGCIAVVIVPSLSNIHFMFVIPPFALMQKVELKNQNKPKWLRLFCRPTHTNSHYCTYHSRTSFQAV